MTKTILYIATSQDGFIADEEGGVSWLPSEPDPEAYEECGYNELLHKIDTIVMGRKSFEQIISFGPWAWPDKLTYVFTSQKHKTSLENVFFVHESVDSFMQRFSEERPHSILWLLGGSELIASFDTEGWIDECIIRLVA